MTQTRVGRHRRHPRTHLLLAGEGGPSCAQASCCTASARSTRPRCTGERRLRATGVVFTLAALGLSDLPPFATFLGKGWTEDSAATRGMTWIIVIFVASSVLVGGAVLRVAGGVFYGLGDPPSEDPQMAQEASEETSETDEGKQRTPLTMIVPAAALVVVAIGITFAPHLGSAVEAAAVRFQDQAAYNATVLSGAHVAHPAAIAPPRVPGSP
jgi:multicomponent Na+:H+ antiporter subunit D